MKNTNLKFHLLTIILICTIGACNVLKPGGDTMLLEGNVFSQLHEPLSNVKVEKNGNILTKSNKEGFFKLNEKEIRIGDVLIFEKDGYVSLVRVYKKNLKISLIMKKRDKTVYFDSNEKYSLKLESGLELSIPQRAFVLDGKDYRGKVQFVATYFDASKRADLISSPALFIAEDNQGNGNIPLSSFGIVDILTLSSENRPLQLNKNISISVKFPIISDNTPSKVNLYSLNTKTGFWALEGVLNNINNQLQGEITTVNRAWNADDPCADQLVCIKVNVQFTNGNPGCGIGATGITYQGFDGLHSPDINGDVQLMVCPNSVFELGACWVTCCGPGVPLSDPCCNNPQYRKTIDLSTITINPTGCTDIGTWVVQN